MGGKTIERMIAESWEAQDGINSMDTILKWINMRNKRAIVHINETSINESTFWFYDDRNGEILNRRQSFFSIIGARYFVDNVFISEQPIILQPEIGYLGIICKNLDGVLHFLMQAKIEPGNINTVQISPTVQATKSNFQRVHGGRLPAYFNYFDSAKQYTLIYDQIQSEQASRFLRKRNRNIIIMVDEEIELLEDFKWVTLGQLKQLLRIDNLVNMDTRTVISGLPYFPHEENDIYDAIHEESINNALFALNQYRMFHNVCIDKVSLNHLVDWQVDEYGVTCKKHSNFVVRFYNIKIAGREVQNWMQPLLKATDRAFFGLMYKRECGIVYILVRIKPEIGNFDMAEFGPTVQEENVHNYQRNELDLLFWELANKRERVKLDVLLSEEGGRFYHEENRNMLIDATGISFDIIMSSDYIWVDYKALNSLIRIGGFVNIQLRNLIALFDVFMLKGE